MTILNIQLGVRPHHRSCELSVSAGLPKDSVYYDHALNRVSVYDMYVDDMKWQTEISQYHSVVGLIIK